MLRLDQQIPINEFRTPCADKNDRLGWTVGESYRLGGFTLGLRSNQSDGLQAMRDLLPADAVKGDQREVEVLLSLRIGEPSTRKGVQNYNLAYNGWTQLARTLELKEAVRAIRDSIGFERAVRRPEDLYLSAQLLEWSGKPIVLVGPASEEVAAELLADGATRLASDLKCPGLVRLPLDASAWSIVIAKPEVECGPISAGQAGVHLMPYCPVLRYRPAETLTGLTRACQLAHAYQVTGEEGNGNILRNWLAPR